MDSKQSENCGVYDPSRIITTMKWFHDVGAQWGFTVTVSSPQGHLLDAHHGVEGPRHMSLRIRRLQFLERSNGATEGCHEHFAALHAENDETEGRSD